MSMSDCANVIQQVRDITVPYLQSLNEKDYNKLVDGLEKMITNNKCSAFEHFPRFKLASDSIHKVGLANISPELFDSVMSILSLLRVIILRGQARLSFMDFNEAANHMPHLIETFKNGDKRMNVKTLTIEMGLMDILDWENIRVQLKDGDIKGPTNIHNNTEHEEQKENNDQESDMMNNVMNMVELMQYNEKILDGLKMLYNYDILLNTSLELSNEEAMKAYDNMKELFERDTR